MKRAIVTILGLIGPDSPKSLYLPGDVTELKEGLYTNTLPILLKSYPDADIIPIYTIQARKKQEEVLKTENYLKHLTIFDRGELIKDEKNFDEIFSIFHKILEKGDYQEFIVDVTHGFRHLPLLLLIELLIKNFQDHSKVTRILFAKELQRVNLKEKKGGKYEFIDLRAYLELANVAFVLGNFQENYTLTSHIKLGEKFKGLTQALNNFSHNILVFNFSKLFEESVPKLKRELKKIRVKPSISRQVTELLDHLEINFTRRPGEPQFYRYYLLGRLLKEKGYLLNSVTLLSESARFFVYYLLQQREPELIGQGIEGLKLMAARKKVPFSDYTIGDFVFKIFRTGPKYLEKNYSSLDPEVKKRLTIQQFEKLVKAIPPHPFKQWSRCPYDPHKKRTTLFQCIMYARNTFAHANRQNNFGRIKEELDRLFNRYFYQIRPYLPVELIKS